MKKESLSFSIHQLIVGRQYADRETFASIASEIRLAQEDGVSGRVNVENAAAYLWMYAAAGRNKPYSTEVLNVKTNVCEANPRNENQAELHNQRFCLYDYSSKLLYVASSGLEFYKKIFHDIDNAIHMRNLYKSREEFLSTLKQVSYIRFVVENDLLNWNNSLFGRSSDMFGLGNPNQLKMEFRFPYAGFTKRCRDFLSGEKEDICDSRTLKSLVVAGRSGEGDRLIESMFNLRTFESSVTIQVEKNDSGLFDPDEVKMALLNQLSE